MDKSDEQWVCASGSCHRVLFARQEAASSRAKDQWDTELSDIIAAKFEVKFQTLAEIGPRLPGEQWHSLTNDIYEMKLRKPAWRAAMFRLGSDWFISHFFLKPAKRRYRAEVERAIRTRELQERWSNG